MGDSADSRRVLAGLSPAQCRAVTSDAGLLCVVAGAGSGKTTVLTRRVAWRVLRGSARPDHVLVLTFTRKAAGELRSRIERLGTGDGVWAATFHSAAYRILRQHWADTGATGPALLSDPEPILRRLLEGGGWNAEAAGAVAAEISWARARLVGEEHYPQLAPRAGRSCPLPPEQLSTVMARYRDHKRRRRIMDLDDLIERCTGLLHLGGAPATALRWRFQHLFVDEFQDVNPAQWRLLESLRGGRPDLCVVGDPRQAIYAWNGSDPSLLDRLPRLLGGTEVVRLDDNHRSSPQIVKVAAALCPPGGAGGARPPEPAGLSVGLSAGLSVGPSVGSSVGPEPTALRHDGPVPTLAGFEDETTEALAVVRWLRTNRRPGHSWRNMAVLARTNARLRAVHDALELAGVPCKRAGAGPDPALSALLRLLASMARSTPLRPGLIDALSEIEGRRPTSSPDGANGTLGAADVAADVGAAAETEAGATSVLGGRVGELADRHAEEEDRPTVGSFLTWLAANRTEDGAGDDADGVVLATFHQAKGLEWRAVAVVGLEDGTLPITYAKDPAALDEERRLLYVALTRAEEHLWCSWARTAGARGGRRRGPSPFLVAVRAAVEEQQPPGHGAAAPHLAELRRRLAGVS